MEKLYENLKTTTEKNYLKRVESIAEYKATKSEKIINAIHEFETIICDQYETRMKTASENGFNYCVLHEFKNDESILEYKKMFLIRGPRNDYGDGSGEVYFKNLNIKPLISKLKEKFNVFRVEMKYNKSQRLNKIIVYW